MKFSDEGIIISQKKYGENSLIVKIFSQHHGIYRGFVKSIKSSKSKTIFQIGNLVSFEFSSRIEENLGNFSAVDLIRSYCSKIIFDRLKVDCVKSIFSIIDSVFLEREEHLNLFTKLHNFLQKISDDDAKKSDFLAEYIKLELKILKTLGYGIDLSSCAATESTDNLVFVSPKSARAVSFSAGEKYQNKLLKLPNFLTEENAQCDDVHLLEGLKLSGFFLKKFLFEEKSLEQDRQQFFHRDNIQKALKQ
jgi:DNA repair protein RecO (recombination protein O)